jgi:glycosylphosphatidylinositol transamidase (GPIT) subunit GPI8
MNLLTTSKEKIEELNNRFFYIMENFIPKYINYLRDPKDDNNKSEITRINDVITNINSDAHVLQNQLQVAIDNNDTKMVQLNADIASLKQENKNMKSRVKELSSQTVTSEGLFDTELDWYKKQLLIILLLFVGIVYGIRLLTGLDMSWLQLAVPISLFIIMKWIYSFMFKG